MNVLCISEARVSFKIQFGLFINIDMGWRTRLLHMAGNYRLKLQNMEKKQFQRWAFWPLTNKALFA